MSAAVGGIRRIEGVQATQPIPRPGGDAGTSKRALGRKEQPEAGLPGRSASMEELTPALEKLAKTAPVFNCRFQFRIHEATKRIMVQVIDQESGEVVNEIPPEKILDLVARIQELVGLLVDKKV